MPLKLDACTQTFTKGLQVDFSSVQVEIVTNSQDLATGKDLTQHEVVQCPTPQNRNKLPSFCGKTAFEYGEINNVHDTPSFKHFVSSPMTLGNQDSDAIKKY